MASTQQSMQPSSASSLPVLSSSSSTTSGHASSAPEEPPPPPSSSSSSSSSSEEKEQQGGSPKTTTTTAGKPPQQQQTIPRNGSTPTQQNNKHPYSSPGTEMTHMASTSTAAAAVVGRAIGSTRPSTHSGNNGNLNHHPPQNSVQRNNSTTKSPSPRNMVSPHMVPEVREYLFKLLVIGELGTGKTSFIKRYVHQYFSQHYRATIGVDFALKVLNWDDNTLIRVQLWDIAGQERFGNMTRVYYKEAVGAFLVFDVNSPQTFNAVIKWKHDLDTKVCLADGNPIPCLLLANKCDSPKEGPASNPETLDKFARDNNFCGWFYTSAKENINVEEASKFLVGKILQRQKHFVMVDHPETSDVISLNYSRHAQSSQPKKCAC